MYLPVSKTLMEKQYSFNERVVFCGKRGWDFVCICVCVFVCVFILRTVLNKNVLFQLKRGLICTPFRNSAVA